MRLSPYSDVVLLTKEGILIKCDPSIKAMLIDIDTKNNHDFIIEDLDEEHLLVKDAKINQLKMQLQTVRKMIQRHVHTLTNRQMMSERLREPDDDSDSEDDKKKKKKK